MNPRVVLGYDGRMKELTKAEIVTILRKTRRLLNKGWTQRANARNAYGNPVNFWSKSACKFCLTGAVRKAISSDKTLDGRNQDVARQIVRLMDRTINKSLSSISGFCSTMYFNDTQSRSARGKQNVIRFVDGLVKTLTR